MVKLIAFTHEDPKKAQKYTDELTVFFELLGSKRVKAASKTLVKSTSEIHKTFKAKSLKNNFVPSNVKFQGC